LTEIIILPSQSGDINRLMRNVPSPAKI
jgi:hypothetical protein